MRLYDLTSEYLELLAALEREAELAATSGDEESEEFLDAVRQVDALLEVLESEIREKVDGYGYVARELKGRIEALRKEEQMLAEKRARAERALDRLKAGVQAALEALEVGGDEPVVKGQVWTARLRRTTAVEVLEEEELIQRGYGEIRQVPAIDKRAIAEVLKERPEELEGLARLVERRYVELR